jgi:hypothetical protein
MICLLLLSGSFAGGLGKLARHQSLRPHACRFTIAYRWGERKAHSHNQPVN